MSSPTISLTMEVRHSRNTRHDGVINTVETPHSCRYVPSRVHPSIFRGRTGLLGTDGGGYRVSAVASDFTDNSRGEQRRTTEPEIMSAPHCIRNEPRMRYQNRPQQDLSDVIAWTAFVTCSSKKIIYHRQDLSRALRYGQMAPYGPKHRD